MSSAILKEHLKKLHAELKTTQTVDNESEKLLATLSEDVQVLLSHKGALSAVHHATIKDRLADAARHFDVSHTSLAATMRTVVHTLNNMGI